MTKKPAKHKQYERDAASVLTQLLEMQGASSVTTVCNAAVVTIEPTQVSEVDILSKYEKNGQREQLAVECKHHKRPVSKTIYGSFRGMLADLKEAHSAMMISPNGYQKGATKLALANSIALCVFTEAKPEFFTDREVPEIDAICDAYYYYGDKVQLFFEKLPAEKLADIRKYCLSTDERQIMMKKESGAEFCLADVYRQIAFSFAGINRKRKVTSYEFTVHTEMQIPGSGSYKIMRLRGVFSHIRFQVSEFTTKFNTYLQTNRRKMFS